MDMIDEVEVTWGSYEGDLPSTATIRPPMRVEHTGLEGSSIPEKKICTAFSLNLSSDLKCLNFNRIASNALWNGDTREKVNLSF
jgi:hypothetical protein